MSPSKFNETPKKEIKSITSPSPLKISKDSHLISKSPSSSSSSSTSSSSLTGVVAVGGKQHPPPAAQQRHPVIIYTHSPKIIHTNARDFMALVQKLTGLSHSSDEQETQSDNNIKQPPLAQDDTGSSSVITEENENGGGGGGGINAGVNTDIQVNTSPPAPSPYLSDVPFFTPNSSSDFYCSSSRPFYRYPDHMFSSPNMIQPSSVLEVLKSYPDYCN